MSSKADALALYTFIQVPLCVTFRNRAFNSYPAFLKRVIGLETSGCGLWLVLILGLRVSIKGGKVTVRARVIEAASLWVYETHGQDLK